MTLGIMRNFVFAASLIAGAAPSHALTITNRDPAPQTVIIIEDQQQKVQIVQPSQRLDGLCPAGCVVQLPNGEDYVLSGNEAISIQDGLIFMDEPAASGGAQPR